MSVPAASPVPVIAIDGPSGVGKGTLMQRVAAELGYHVLDSGATYRLLALAAARAGVALDDATGLAALVDALDVSFEADLDSLGPPRAMLAGVDVSAALRSERCGQDASRLAALAPVRAVLLGMQRAFRRPPGLVADGRDMGTVVFPDAEVKLFLDASVEQRAERRHKQLIEKGESASLSALLEELAARDRRDRERAASPLRPAPDAEVMDTTHLDADAVFAVAMDFVRKGIAHA